MSKNECVVGENLLRAHHAFSFFRSSWSCLCIALAALIFTSGCVSAGGVRDVRGDDQATIIKVPFYPQKEYQCGPASLAAVLNFWGVPVTPEDVAKDIYSRSARGTLSIDMVLYAKEKGLEASWYAGGPDDLRQEIDSGLPLIVLVDRGFSVFQVNHFMVVVGYSGKGVIVNSGRDEKEFVPMDEFLREWERTRFWTLLIRK
jgi:hypothetical protein